MFSKLLKKDLKKNMRWLWILFVSTIAIAGITRGTKELGKNIAFFKVMYVFFEGVFYGLAVNQLIQPFLRNFLNFQKSIYSDESYLTHTLPVTKNQLINSRYLTGIIELLCGFASLIVSILIIFASPTFFTNIKIMLSTLVEGNFSVGLLLTLFIILVIVEFLMFLSIIYFSIVLAYKSKEHRILNAFLITTAMAFASLIVLSLIMIIILSINGIKLTTSTLILSNSALISVIITGIAVYTSISALFYFLTKHELNKGVNVD